MKRKFIPKTLALALMLTFQIVSYGQTVLQKQVLVYFKTGVTRNASPNQNTVTISSTTINQLLTNYNLSATNVTPSFPTFNEADTVNIEIGESSRQMNLAKVFTISLPDTSFKASLLSALNNLSEVLYAESDGDVTTNIIPTDGFFAQQWNMRNTLVPGADIHLDGATNIFTGNPNSIIAVIDGGVDVNHVDLAAKITGGNNTFTITTNPITGVQFSHGSHVAGIAAASTNNVGVAGVDWQARIHSRHVIGNSTGDAGITQAIRDAVTFSPNVWTLNHSWSTLPIGRYSATVRSAFATAYRNNRVSSVAMGNHHTGAPNADDIPAFPAGFNSGQIAVGATDIFDDAAGFSARGAHIDVSAPGVGILSTNFNNGYINLNGTSMATPHVAGLASLLKGFNTNLANDDIEQIIRLTADDQLPVGFDNTFGAGRINAERALQSLQAPNTLQHLSTTGATVFSTDNIQTRIFLGVPFFPDAAYRVQRREVRTNVTFPPMCNIIGVWGRGIGTTGYREERNRIFGEGICEVVPGTLTNTGCTLRTWIYEVATITGQYLGFYPASPQNVVMQYTILGVPLPTAITGLNSTICSQETYNLNVPAPTGATVTWSATPSNIVSLTPNGNQVTVQRNGIASAVVTLTAAISNGCSGSNTTIQRTLIIGTPAPSLSVNVYCPEAVAFVNNSQAATSFTWTLETSSGTQTINSSSSVETFKNIYSNAYLCVTYDNVCGTSYPACYVFDCSSNGEHRFAASPNPTSGDVQIETIGTDKKTSIKEIQVTDKYGNIKKTIKLNTNPKKHKINIADLPADVYIIRIYDGKTWVSKKVIKS